MVNIGNRIKTARQKKGMSQEELAQAIGATKAAVSRYEAGKRRPSYDQLQRIAAALGTSTSNLLPPDNYWEDENGVGHTEPQVPTIEVHDEPIQAPKVVVHDDPPEELEELEALLAKLQDGEPLVLSPEELAKLKATPKKRVSSALERMKHEGVVVEVQSPLYKLRSMPQSGRVARFNKKFGVDFGDGETVSLDGKMGSGKSTVINELIKITNDPQHRIAAALDQLNDEGREKAAERVEELTEIPRYRAQNAPQDTPPAPGGTDTTPATDGPQRPQEPPTGPSVIVLTMVCPLCARRITGDVVTKTAYCPNCKKSFPLPQK